MFTVVAAVAELERSLIAERVKAGLRNAKSKGRPIGRKRLAEVSPELVDQITSLRAQGLGMCKIAEVVGVSPRTVWRYTKVAA